MTTKTITFTCKGKPNIEITKEQLEESLFTGKVCSKIGMTHRVFVVEIGNTYRLVAISCGTNTDIQGNANGCMMEVKKRDIKYWG